MNPRMWAFIIKMMSTVGFGDTGRSSNFDVDLDAVRDRQGMKDFIRGGAEPPMKPLPVMVTNTPSPYPSGV